MSKKCTCNTSGIAKGTTFKLTSNVFGGEEDEVLNLIKIHYVYTECEMGAFAINQKWLRVFSCNFQGMFRGMLSKTKTLSVYQSCQRHLSAKSQEQLKV